ncbi:MAG: nucleotidyltransferase family protein [Leptolyngbyaceae cyanobacterium]
MIATPPTTANRSHWQPPPATTWQPTAQHLLLLQAIFAEDAAAIAAWRTWGEQIDIEQLDEGSYWLLPRLYKRWQDGLPHRKDETQAIWQRIKGVYRHVWSRNQLILWSLGEAVQSLQAAQIPVVVMGGAALVATPDADIGSRRADDSGLWVPESSLGNALGQLRDLGWQPTRPLSPEQLRSQQTAVGLRRHSDTLTLCWWPLPECPALGRAGEVNNGGLPVQLANTEAIALNPTDQCFLCCIQATRWQPGSPVYWLADAVDLLQRYPIQGDRLVQLAQTHQLVLPLKSSLMQIAPLVGSHEVETILDRLKALPVSPFERAEFAVKGQANKWGQLPTQWFEYRRLYPQFAGPQRAWNFGPFLARRWGLKSAWQIPLHIFQRGVQRLSKPKLNP